MLLVFIMSLVMGAAIWQFMRVSDSVEGILKANFQTILAAQEMDAALHQEEVAFLLLLDGDIARARQKYEEGQRSFDRALAAASEYAIEDSEQVVLASITEKSAQIRRLADRFLVDRPGRSTTRVGPILQNVIQPSLEEARQLAMHLRRINEAQVVASYEEAQGRADRSVQRSFLTSFGALVLAILLGLRMVQRSLAPIADLAARAERIAQGIFLPSSVLKRDDEIGALSKSFDAMEAKLAEGRETEARRLQRAEQMSDAALDSLYDPVVVTDARCRIVYLNRAAEGLFGRISFAERRPVGEHIPDRRIVRAIENALEERVSASEDDAAHATVRVGESERIYRLRSTPMKDEADHLLGSVTVLEDITHLRIVDRLKTEFIGVASHELRTPVTSLILANGLLLEGAVGELEPAQREVVQAQGQDLDRLEKLMRDLLDVTRLEAGSSPLRLEFVAPRDLIEGPLSTLRPQALRKGIKLEVDIEERLPNVRADRTQIGRVITNLVANAIRHTKPEGQVTVRASATDKDVCFRVEDTGEGIPKDYLDRIFERFVQVPGATQGGAGLGLSIAQNIVRAHGGGMNVESEVGRGSVFGFTLPIEVGSGGQVA
jgi:signal transduction histidine kinase